MPGDWRAGMQQANRIVAAAVLAFAGQIFLGAVLASMFRWRNLPRLLENPDLLERAVHGSDFPFPSNAMVFWNRVAPANLAPLLRERNLFERDYRLKQALGFPPEVFERGAKLLAAAGRAS